MSDFLFLCTFSPGSEKSTERTFAPVEHSLPWNFRSSGANIPRTFIPVKLSFPENEYSKNFRSKCPNAQPKTGYKPYNSRHALICVVCRFILANKPLINHPM